MTDFNTWILQRLRTENNAVAMDSGWLEVMRYKLHANFSSAIDFVVNGGTLLLCVDPEFLWLCDFVTENFTAQNRPFVPIFPLHKIFPRNLTPENLPHVQDLLSVALKDYAFWFIGHIGSARANLCLDHGRGFLWILDNELPNAFTLHSRDPMINFKLIQLCKIFEAALFGTIFGEISLS